MSDPVLAIMNDFQNFDPNIAGDPAIVSLKYLSFESGAEAIPPTGRLVLVLVESRLTDPLPGAPNLEQRLVQFKRDLRAEGFYSCFVTASVYQGSHDQDGRTVLALREFLRDVKKAYPQFSGVVLVGTFPEATLVRRTIWRMKRGGTKIGNVTTANEDLLWIEPGMIASRADIVLADLGGNWESIYHESPLDLEWIQAIPDTATSATSWPVDGGVFSSTIFNRKHLTFHDFFWIQDDDYEVLDSPPGLLQLYILKQQRNAELSATDRGLPNPIARPDLVVSRLNAHNVARNPGPTIHGDDGTPALDAAGHPQAFTTTQDINTVWGILVEDPLHERQLLCDYFDRNHRFRVGASSNLPFRGAAIACTGFSAQGLTGQLALASPSFQSPYVQEDATILDYVRWLKQPAALRWIEAHALETYTAFSANYNVVDLEHEVGGPPFRWTRFGNTYQPSLQDQGGNADWFLHRTLWQNRTLENAGANLMIHTGCLVMGVPGEYVGNPPQQHYKGDAPQYHNEGYAVFQNAETMLFYLNGLAMVARAKDFNDSPTGFTAALAQSRGHFGDGWTAYFNNESHDSELLNQKSIDYWGAYSIRCKKAYWWTVIGDWTARLQYRAGLGTLGFEPDFRALQIHPDQAWIGGWNFVTGDNTIVGSGDLDGDGVTELIVTSPWGIGILKPDCYGWQNVLIAPNGTRFDGFLLNTHDNTFGPVADFNGDGRDEIFVKSPWGIGILSFDGDTLHALLLSPNGTRFEGFLLNTADDHFGPVGDFNGDGRDEIFVSSAWGIGILSLDGNTLRAPLLSPNGTRFDGFLLNTPDDHFGPVGDFDGDGCDEIFVSSAWGIGILSLDGNTLRAPLLSPNGTRFEGFLLNTPDDHFGPVGDFSGNGRDEIFVSSAWGIGILALDGNALRAPLLAPNGTHFDGFWLNTADDHFGPMGEFEGDGRGELVVTSAWGTGILALDGGTLHSKLLAANGTHLGNWILDAKDRIVAVGKFSGSGSKQQLVMQKGT